MDKLQLTELARRLGIPLQENTDPLYWYKDSPVAQIPGIQGIARLHIPVSTETEKAMNDINPVPAAHQVLAELGVQPGTNESPALRSQFGPHVVRQPHPGVNSVAIDVPYNRNVMPNTHPTAKALGDDPQQDFQFNLGRGVHAESGLPRQTTVPYALAEHLANKFANPVTISMHRNPLFGPDRGFDQMRQNTEPGSRAGFEAGTSPALEPHIALNVHNIMPQQSSPERMAMGTRPDFVGLRQKLIDAGVPVQHTSFVQGGHLGDSTLQIGLHPSADLGHLQKVRDVLREHFGNPLVTASQMFTGVVPPNTSKSVALKAGLLPDPEHGAAQTWVGNQGGVAHPVGSAAFAAAMGVPANNHVVVSVGPNSTQAVHVAGADPSAWPAVNTHPKFVQQNIELLQRLGAVRPGQHKLLAYDPSDPALHSRQSGIGLMGDVMRTMDKQPVEMSATKSLLPDPEHGAPQTWSGMIDGKVQPVGSNALAEHFGAPMHNHVVVSIGPRSSQAVHVNGIAPSYWGAVNEDQHPQFIKDAIAATQWAMGQNPGHKLIAYNPSDPSIHTKQFGLGLGGNVIHPVNKVMAE